VVYEKRPDMRREKISAGRSINLALANRGIRPLQEVGLMPQVRDVLIPMKGRMLHDEQGQLTLAPYGQRPHEVIYSVSRAGLNSLLMNAAEATGRVRIEFEQAIEAVDFGKRSAQVRDQRGGEPRAQRFELLFGADGAGSPVRRALDAHHGTPSTEEKLFHSYKELHIPGTAGGGFRMEKEALHIWPRGDFMMIGLPNPDGSFTMTLFAPDAGPVSFAALHDRASFDEFFQRNFPDALALMPDAAQSYFRNPTGFLGTVHCPHWFVDDAAAVIGDAAHAIVPFHGQGMNCGFEDCHDLDALLEEHGDDWTAVLPAYEALRKPNAEAIALMAQENYVEMRATVRDPEFQLQKAVGFELERRFPERFIPRYSMVMFHHLPYTEALRRGRENERILERLCAHAGTPADVDWQLADQLLRAT
jgi:kynurenine 3-monooxygenase